MSSEQDDLRLNTLHRFAKHSPRLVLEEYSHCEVPAGCGGVVIRWADAAAGTAAIIHVACMGRVQAYLDGRAVDSGRVHVAPGDHLLALHITDIEGLERPAVLTRIGEWITGASARKDPATGLPATPFALAILRPQHATHAGTHESERLILGSSMDGAWLAAESAPSQSDAEDWWAPDFDDSTWRALRDGRACMSGMGQDHRWRFDQVTDMGAEILRIVGTEAWIRCAFDYRCDPERGGQGR
ncbi:MAG: hypothetical protein MJE77_18290 [Proteobacteria bacterium]|nr:hypothetical protein [Pseudomonadota bacterium]